MLPEFHRFKGESPVEVCGTSSVLVQWTESPSRRLTAPGLNEKFVIVTSAVAASACPCDASGSNKAIQVTLRRTCSMSAPFVHDVLWMPACRGRAGMRPALHLILPEARSARKKRPGTPIDGPG